MAVGGVVRTGDKFVTGEAAVAVQLYDQYCIKTEVHSVAVPQSSPTPMETST